MVVSELPLCLVLKPCRSTSNEALACTSPVINLPDEFKAKSNSQRRKRQSDYDDDAINDEVLKFDLDIDLDGDLSMTPPPPGGADACDGVCVYHNPHVEPFFPEVQDFTKHVTIKVR